MSKWKLFPSTAVLFCSHAFLTIASSSRGREWQSCAKPFLFFFLHSWGTWLIIVGVGENRTSVGCDTSEGSRWLSKVGSVWSLCSEKNSICPLGTNAANTVAFNVTYFCPSGEIPVLLNVGHFWNRSSRFASRKKDYVASRGDLPDRFQNVWYVRITYTAKLVNVRHVLSGKGRRWDFSDKRLRLRVMHSEG